ncbi:MAG: phosphotransferase [Candidatus Sumerlaeia bacterium]|nr:phosphotransferase [Candidatus Sumerlaeia bacterium]
MTTLICDPEPTTRDARLFADLVRKKVLPQLVPSGTGERAVLRDRIAEGHATSDHVRMLQFDGDDRVHVVRAMYRPFNPVRPGGRFKRFDQAADFCRLVHAQGIPTPRIECVLRGVDWSRWIQYWIAVEEFIEGRELDRREPGDVLAAFDLLGRLHSIRSDRWGREGFFAGGNAASFARKAIAPRILHQLTKTRHAIPPSTRQELAAWAIVESDAFVRRLGERPFSLVHGDFKITNCLAASDGRIVLIDFLHTRYWLAGLEFLDALAHFCGGNGMAQQAARRYFAATDPEVARQFREGGQVLLFLAAAAWLGSKGPADGLAPEGTVKRLLGRRFRELIDGADTDWDEVVRVIREFQLFAADAQD